MAFRSSLLLAACLAVCLSAAGTLDAETPRSTDDRIVVELFAEHPRIVTPTGIAVDAKGRVFVAESHTHFRPDNYQGPTADRILMFAMFAAGSAQRQAAPTVFHEGYRHVMDLQFHPDGSLYVATRKDIHRMRDTTGDGRADEVKQIVRLDTTGTYPHNGLSGLAFDFHGNLVFGLGENLGHDYRLIGTDGRKLSGGGEGGTTYQCRADGSELRRTSTGWWNPFGMCVDALGRVFGTDNDPGASPPCRLIQVIERGDYGYEYRYGRTGLHPLITWTGELPGTVPMIAGTGEAPCEIVAYESDGLPPEYYGNLLVASWADHRIEFYRPRQSAERGLVETRRQVLIEGDDDFRPVGIAIGPDGALYVSDWVSSSYTLHRQGRIWRVRAKSPPAAARPKAPAAGILVRDRAWREQSARRLLAEPTGPKQLGQLMDHDDPYVRAVALQALSGRKDKPQPNLQHVGRHDRSIPLRVLAVRKLMELGGDPAQWLADRVPAAVRIEALYHADPSRHAAAIERALSSGEPALYRAAVAGLSRHVDRDQWQTRLGQRDPAALLLAHRLHDSTAGEAPIEGRLNTYLAMRSNPAARLLAVKWIADRKLTDYRSRLVELLDDPQLNHRLFLAVSAALDRLAGRKPADVPAAKFLLSKINDEAAPVAIRRLSLRMIDPANSDLDVKQLISLLSHRDLTICLEAARTLARHPSDERIAAFRALALDSKRPVALRAEAVSGLATAAEKHVEDLLRLVKSPDRTLSDEALRALVGVKLTATQNRHLEQFAAAEPAARQAVARLLKGVPEDRPAATKTDVWAAMIAGRKGDVEAGRRVFFHSKVGTCSKCHQINGRGVAVGPSLTLIDRRLRAAGSEKRLWLLETLLQPSRDMAPQYTPWQIVTKDGKSLTGLPRRKGGNAEAYLGLDGREFTVRKPNIEFHRELTTSVMPADLLNQLTRQELADLVAFIMADK